MKKLFALACAAIFSMFAGIEVVLPKDDAFYFNPDTGAGDYFQVDIDTDVDYRNLYGQVHGFNWEGAEMCDTTQRQDSRDAWVSLSERTNEWSAAQGIYDPVFVGDDGSVTVETTTGGHLLYTLHSNADINICAPASGTINTSHYACSYGSYMEYIITLMSGESFTVTIEGAKCWYCCAGKSTPEDGRYTATTSESLKGKTMRAGDVLCVGQNGTTITIAHTAASSY